MSIRTATVDDIDALFTLSCRVHTMPPYTDLVPNSHRKELLSAYANTRAAKRQYEKKLLRYIDKHDAWAHVYEIDGRIVGFRLMYRNEDGLHLRGLYVDPDYQGQGIGLALFSLAFKYMSPGEMIELPVLESNAKARRLYEKNGFIVTDTVLPDFHGMKQVQMTYQIPVSD